MRSLWVSVLAGSVLVVSGCGGGAKPPEAAPPSESGTPSTTASPSESGTPEAPVTLPAEVRGTSTEAARQTVLLFVEEVNRSGQNGDTRLARRLFTKDCQNCEAITSRVEAVYGAGGEISGETWEQVEVASPNTALKGYVGLSVRVRYGAQTMKASPGAKIERAQGGVRQILSFTLAKVGGRWQIVTMNTDDA